MNFNNRVTRMILFSFNLSLVAVACDLSSKNSDVAEEIEIAETVIYNFRQVKVSNGRKQYEINAQKAETFSEQDKTRITNMKFVQYDKEMNPVADGEAAKVDYFMKTENAIVDGEMVFSSQKEGVQVFSSWLDWNSKKKVLSGKDDVPVRLEKKNGTVIEGKGFRAETDTKTVSFTKGMTGLIVPEKKRNEDEK